MPEETTTNPGAPPPSARWFRWGVAALVAFNLVLALVVVLRSAGAGSAGSKPPATTNSAR
jgi:hypothetical protein